MPRNGVPFSQGEVMVLSPNQVKSATQNNGGFSRANDDIAFSMERKLAAAHTLSVDKCLAVAVMPGRRRSARGRLAAGHMCL